MRERGGNAAVEGCGEGGGEGGSEGGEEGGEEGERGDEVGREGGVVFLGRRRVVPASVARSLVYFEGERGGTYRPK